MKTSHFSARGLGFRFVLALAAVTLLFAGACSPRAWRQTADTAAAPAATLTAAASKATATPEIVSYATALPSATPLPVTATPTAVGADQAAQTVALTASVVMPNRPDNENPLTGLPVDDPTTIRRRPLHVRVGNDTGARPQVGLNQAEIVYEDVVEWWVTRFTAVYLSQSPEIVAPIRSARLINTQLGLQYQAALANSGGSDGVRWEISQLPIVNLDEYYWPRPYFYRENEGWQTRLALNTEQARQLMKTEKLEKEIVLRGFTFSDAPVGGDEAATVFIPYPKRTSAAEWRYDSVTGRYLRWVLGVPFMDADDKQISAANVIVYFADHQATDIVEDSNGATSIRIIVNGEGRAQVFRDGKVMNGRWQADGSQTPLFTFENGEQIPLKRGNTWIEVVPLDYAVLVNATPEPTATP